MKILLAIALVAAPGAAAAAGEAPIRHTVRFPAPHTHYAEVEAVFPTGGRPAVTLMMAVWTPGSYLVREFSRHVEAVAARGADGRALPVRKTRKNRWRVETGGADAVTVTYRVYGREMSVRTNWIEADFALLNGAPTFLVPVGDLKRPHEVQIEPADGWKTSVTALDRRGPHRYRAADYDELVDSPIYVGNPEIHRFEVDGIEHLLVQGGDPGGLWDGAKAARDVEKIVREAGRFWGSLPYDRYVFLNLVTEARGGLEHLDSTVIMASRWAFRDRESYVGWLGLVAHELFHAWNVKRLRPAALGPFDYEAENYTRSLWIVEGFTSYYAPVLVRRAGLVTDTELLKALARRIEAVQKTPGRHVRSLEQASFDAWIKHYRPDENSVNTTVSYYSKGAVVGFLLDARIREVTGGRRSLDDVMRRAYERFSGERGYTPAEFRAVIDEVAGAPLGELVDRAVADTAELDYGPALAWFGLERAPPDPPADGEKPPARGWLGLELRDDGGRLVVREVVRGTPAHAAGVNADDEVIGVDGYRVPPDLESWKQRRSRYAPGTRARLLVARRERLLRLPVTFGAEPAAGWKLRIAAKAPPEAARRRAAWLGGGD